MAFLHNNEGYGKASHFPDLYSDGLRSLVTTSNEKQVTADYLLSQRLGRRVLDIGAGNGEIARLLKPRPMDQYVAVERNPVLVEQLGRLGVGVLEGVSRNPPRWHIRYGFCLTLPTCPASSL